MTAQKRKSKQDITIELLGSICEKLDNLLSAIQRIGSGYVPYIPPPAKKPDPYPTIMLYGCFPPSGTGKPWDDHCRRGKC